MEPVTRSDGPVATRVAERGKVLPAADASRRLAPGDGLVPIGTSIAAGNTVGAAIRLCALKALWTLLTYRDRAFVHASPLSFTQAALNAPTAFQVEPCRSINSDNSADATRILVQGSLSRRASVMPIDCKAKRCPLLICITPMSRVPVAAKCVSLIAATRIDDSVWAIPRNRSESTAIAAAASAKHHECGLAVGAIAPTRCPRDNRACPHSGSNNKTKKANATLFTMFAIA